MSGDPRIARLLDTFGPDLIRGGAEVPARHAHDWSGLPPVAPLALARPRSTEEVSRVLALANELGLGVVPQGGLSGISGGAHPTPGVIALSTSRMTRIVAVDPEMALMEAEAGVVLATAQEAAEEAGLMLPVDLGARGSCTIGGIVSTNAGGTQVLRYGMARDLVLGLEAVLADGTVLPSMNRLLKNNTGLDLKQMFIGTEGLLGVVTKAVLRLQPKPTERRTAFAGCRDTAAMIALLARMRRALGPALSGFEVMWPSYYEPMQQGSGAGHPLAGRHGVYAIIEATGFEAGLGDLFEAALMAAIEEGVAEDAVIAASLREERALWAVREATAEFPRIVGPLTAFDVGVRLSACEETVRQVEDGLARRFPGARVLSYGHLGDNNLHFVVNVPDRGADQPGAEIKDFVYGVIRDHGGTISAEHGLGLIKGHYLGHSRSEAEIATMRAVKALLDPKGILNPGKGFAP